MIKKLFYQLTIFEDRNINWTGFELIGFFFLKIVDLIGGIGGTMVMLRLLH